MHNQQKSSFGLKFGLPTDEATDICLRTRKATLNQSEVPFRLSEILSGVLSRFIFLALFTVYSVHSFVSFVFRCLVGDKAIIFHVVHCESQVEISPK